MIRRKEVATLLSTDQIARQPVWRRAAVRVHLLMCRHCRRFARQLTLLKQAATDLGAGFDGEIGGDFPKRVKESLRGLLSVAALGLLAPAFMLGASVRAQTAAAVSAPVDVTRLGPQVGDKVPEFSLVDQHGQPRTLASLMGANGLVLTFDRSADW